MYVLNDKSWKKSSWCLRNECVISTTQKGQCWPFHNFLRSSFQCALIQECSPCGGGNLGQDFKGFGSELIKSAEFKFKKDGRRIARLPSIIAMIWKRSPIIINKMSSDLISTNDRSYNGCSQGLAQCMDSWTLIQWRVAHVWQRRPGYQGTTIWVWIYGTLDFSFNSYYFLPQMGGSWSCCSSGHIS